jgi:hypothetical protein
MMNGLPDHLLLCKNTHRLIIVADVSVKPGFVVRLGRMACVALAFMVFH